MKGLTVQERRVLVAILLALVLGALVRYWRRQGDGGATLGGDDGVSKIEQGVKNGEGGRPQ